MKQKLNTIKLAGFVLLAFSANAQKDAQRIYEGNSLYHSGKFPESTLLYTKAIEANPNNKKANFNLGNSLYRNAELVKSGAVPLPPGTKITPDSLSKLIYDQAAQNFAVVANSVSNKDTLHQAWHNIGNCYLKKKEYQQAVDAYKKSLKYNDKDEETRYNLAYALKNLPKDKKNGGGGSNQQQNKKEEDKKDQQKNAQPQQNQMNKEQAEQLLKALMDNEKKLQDKRKQKAEANSSNVEKDW
jgi:tetratricopeptide (TPR) repeat protein